MVFREIRTVRTPGTSFLAKSKRFWNKSVMTIGSAPAARAASKDVRPIGPAPLLRCVQRYIIGENDYDYQMTRGSPRRRPERSMPASATARGSQREPSS